MLYTYTYDTNYSPSMPIIDLVIGRAQMTPSLQITAIVDSGADATMIPVVYLEQISARKGKQAIVRGYLGRRDVVVRYDISLEFAHFSRKIISVVGVTQTTEAVIGRDILNTLVVTLDGLASAVEIPT